MALRQGRDAGERDAADAGKPEARARGRIHRLGAGGGEPQNRLGGEAAGASPGGEVADAVAGHDRAGGQDRGDHPPAGEPRDAAEDLPGPVPVQVRAGRPDEVARVGAAEERPGGLEDRARLRGVAREREHLRALAALAGEQHRERHGPVSRASTKRVMARRSAAPPGLSRRATKARCSAAARANQSSRATPPARSKRAAASRAKR